MKIDKEVKTSLLAGVLISSFGILISLIPLFPSRWGIEDSTKGIDKSKVLELNLLVKDPEGLPITEAEITYSSDEKPPIRTVTDSNGFVSIFIEAREEPQIEIQKEGYKTRIYNINLQADANRVFVFSLDPEEE